MKNPLVGEQNAHDRKQPENSKNKNQFRTNYINHRRTFFASHPRVGIVDGRSNFCNLKNHVRPLARTLSDLTWSDPSGPDLTLPRVKP